ncbi:MAG: 2Fe-2S iron-sulfur cluster-binding protein [Devosiaceae bacterium]|nr:2Fe-2S iron-sulfur cluster-binding protein [Devosiaceae bacterium]
MSKIIFVSANGERQEVSAENGATIMEVAIKNDIAGIIGECGGACTCATCHVYIDKDWLAKAGEPSVCEEDMLDFASDVRDESRLSCQVKVSDELDGIIVHVPERQG